MADFDTPWKEALDFFFEPFLELFFPQGARPYRLEPGMRVIGQGTPANRPRSGNRAAIRRQTVVKVWLKSGAEQWVLVCTSSRVPPMCRRRVTPQRRFAIGDAPPFQV
jgi:hypothetical protein